MRGPRRAQQNRKSEVGEASGARDEVGGEVGSEVGWEGELLRRARSAVGRRRSTPLPASGRSAARARICLSLWCDTPGPHMYNIGSGLAKSRRSRPSPDVAPRSYVQVCLEVPSVASRHCMIFQRLLRGSFGNLEAIHDSSLGCLEDHAGASRQTSTYESVPRLDMRECLDVARPLPI